MEGLLKPCIEFLLQGRSMRFTWRPAHRICIRQTLPLSALTADPMYTIDSYRTCSLLKGSGQESSWTMPRERTMAPSMA